MREEIIEKLRKIKLLLLDVDGVLTEGSIIYDSQGRELKIFNVKDGLGIFLLTQRGFPVVILSAKNSKVVKKRAKDMGIRDVFWGYPKEKVLDKILKKYKVSAEEIAFIGDDLIDVEVAKRVGLSFAVADASPFLKEVVDFVTNNRGGKGAVREVAELIMEAKSLF